jgi:hypothetical protein
MNDIRIQPDGNRLFHGTIELADNRPAPIGDFRDIGQVDLLIRNIGQRLQGLLLLIMPMISCLPIVV